MSQNHTTVKEQKPSTISPDITSYGFNILIKSWFGVGPACLHVLYHLLLLGMNVISSSLYHHNEGDGGCKLKVLFIFTRNIAMDCLCFVASWLVKNSTPSQPNLESTSGAVIFAYIKPSLFYRFKHLHSAETSGLNRRHQPTPLTGIKSMVTWGTSCARPATNWNRKQEFHSTDVYKQDSTSSN